MTAAACAAAPVWAQTPPPASQAATEDDDPIIIRADRGDQVRIDRRTYSIRNDPAAQATDMYDVLGRIPSVSVAPSGDVTLLGASGVTIQVNSQNVPGQSLEQVLRGLTGADVERIEVITNPSAQYSSATSGGIINIITREHHDLGFTGNVNAGADSFGSYQMSVSPNWSHGRWSFGGRVGHNEFHGPQDFHRAHTETDPSADFVEQGRVKQEFSGSGASAHATYQPNEKSKTTLSLDSYAGQSDVLQDTDRTNGATPISRQFVDAANPYEFDRLGLNFQRDGAKPREQIRLNAALSHWSYSNDSTVSLTPASSAPSAFFNGNAQSSDGANVTLDYDLPFSGRQFLTTGLSADVSTTDSDTVQRTLLGVGPGNLQAALHGHERTFAAYGTYQFGGGDWTFLPGLRVEAYHRDVTFQAAADDSDDLQTFPTLHLQRAIGDAIQLDLSYSRRIERRDLTDLDPTIHFYDATHASSGNPNLKPSFTNAYEANFTYQAHGAIYTATFYDRISRDITSPFVTQSGGVTLTTTVNAGEREQRGLQVIARAPLSTHWRYSLTANLADSQFDVLRSGVLQRDSAFEYDGNASLEFRDPDQTVVGANDFQIDLRFQGPRHTLQQETDQFTVVNLSWRRRLTNKLFSFLQVQDAFSSIRYDSLTRGDDFTERSIRESQGARIRLSLTYQLGTPTGREPQEPSDNGGGPGGGPQ
ncbi:MAG: outer membrane beta-barrel protein [Pseudomonadota bacterium]